MLDCWPVFPCQTCWLQPHYLQSGPEKLVSWSWHLHCQILRTLLLLDLNIENSLLQHNQVELKISTFCHLLLAIGTRKKIEYWYFLIFCSPTILIGTELTKLVSAPPQPRSWEISTILLIIISSLDKKENTNTGLCTFLSLPPCSICLLYPRPRDMLLVWPS